jgi:hypothetical protein
MRSKPTRKGERFIEFLAIGVVPFDLNKFIAIVVLFSQLLDAATATSERGERKRREKASYLPRIQIFLTAVC